MPNWTKEQLDAINLDNSNIIVSAGAGSGKTAVLTERVLRKVKDGINVNELLVLTFTNAAAAEMKERIRGKLKENNLIDQLSKLDSAYITTFDAYSLSLVKKYHYLLNINKNISICEKSIMDIKKKEIIENIFEEFYDNNKFQKLINDFCSKDDKNIKDEILVINDKLDMLYNKKEYLKNYITKYYSDEFIESKIEEYLELIRKKISLINEYYIELEEYVDNDYYEKITNLLSELLNAKEYKDIIIPKLPNMPKDSEEEAKKIKNKISSLLKEITSLTQYNDVTEIKNEIFKTKEYVEIIIDIINEFDIRINKYKNDNDLYEFIDIAKMAIKLVEENELIRKELNYNEILIDEYQDTNDLQELFISYIENNNVYMVGDIKQSIYRFRNANPKLFKEKYDNYSKNNGGIKIDLNKNFRSREEVLENINLIFNQLMDDLIGGANYKKEHQMIYGNLGYSLKDNLDYNIQILNYEVSEEYKKNEIEIFTIANDIKNKMGNYKIFNKGNLRQIKYSDIAILMDRTVDFNLYKKIFEYLGIPLTLYKEEKVNDSIELSLIKNILTFMITDDETKKKYSFVSILRSYLFSLEDNKIFEYIVNNDYSFLDDYKFDCYTPYEITEFIIEKYDFYNKIITVGDIESRMAVLEYLTNLSLNLTNIGYDINDYLEYLEKVIEENIEIRYSVNNKDNDSVKIMTIHKSKGLEFPICYYSGLTSSFNMGELKEMICFDKNIGLITPINDNGIKNTIYKELLKNNYYKEEIAEKIRLFYVALTRAKEKMIVLLPKKELEETTLDNNVKMGYRSLSDMLYSIFSSLSQFIKNIELKNIDITKKYNVIKVTNYKDKIEKIDKKINKIEIQFETKEKVNKHFSKINYDIYSKNDYKNIEYGKYIHSLFENIDFDNPDFTNINNFEKDKILLFLKNPIFNNVINIYKEYEFIENDNHGIIDLLLECENEYKIIDYKLKNVTDDAYINQLKGYKEYIEKITEKPVSTYLYSILDNLLIEINVK